MTRKRIKATEFVSDTKISAFLCYNTYNIRTQGTILFQRIIALFLAAPVVTIICFFKLVIDVKTPGDSAHKIGLYLLVTSRCAGNFDIVQQTKAIKVGDYLPFDAKSQIVKLDASLQLTRDLPVMDGAAALLPVYSAFVHVVAPADSYHYGAIQCTNTIRAYKGVLDER